MFSISQYLSQISNDDKKPTPSSTQISVFEPRKKSHLENIDSNSKQSGSKLNQRATIDDIKPSRSKYIRIPRPSQEEIDATTERTKKALDVILQEKLGKVSSSNNKAQPEFIRYNSTNVLSNNGATSSRLIKIIDVKQDPMAPPKFKQKKQFAAAKDEPIAPILHAPVAKLSQEEQKKWYIPPAISNWKNPNGYSIGLDKRLAVDGRDPNLFKDEGMNDNFVNLSEALDDADKKAREELKARNALKKQQLEAETKQKEEQLRLMAEKARQDSSNNRDYRIRQTREYQERLNDREERRQRAQRELKSNRSTKDRDVSERREMSQTKTTKTSSDSQFDSRLFTNSVVAQHSETEVYDKPFFLQKSVSNFFKDQGTGNNLEDLGPVEFVKGDNSNKRTAEEEEEDFDQDGSNKRQRV
ncbi:hypothetical protein WICPIJ_002496 [Wickerhamomyces pijperi]|uniref:Pre-mRNA-processing protein 45 n=1 Tax=Wickerhamomyces pijperi TaxID=599730 RepID=A0A9P8Q9I3_WICPI|nr:hypothetical protein WICPIJ_002496 [Wickerhamomyces pijperi]